MINKLVVFIIFLFSYSTAFSQNLIYNGDFELHDTCPNDNSQIRYCTGWKNPNQATADYYNSCDASNYFSVPSNFLGHQEAFNGNAYAGFLAFEGFSDQGGAVWYEYVMGELTSPLEKDTIYHLSYRLSCADRISNYSVAKLGALFTESPVNHKSDPGFIDSIPQIINTGGPLKDTVNWMILSGNFIAKGGERYITLGYFGGNTIADTSSVQFIFQTNMDAYYYVDSVQLVKAERITPPSVFAEKCDSIFVPSVFSPNGDGINDSLRVRGGQCIKGLEFFIYNRWGEQVFEYHDDEISSSQDKERVWDGRYKEQESIPGVYAYSVNGIQNGKAVASKGIVSLIR